MVVLTYNSFTVLIERLSTIYIFIKHKNKHKLIEETNMKNWSICNISEGMESEVKLSHDDIVDSFLNENGIYAGNPLLEFIDIKRLKRSLLKEMDADVPQHIVNPPARTRTAEVKFEFTEQSEERDEDGRASFKFTIGIPSFSTEREKEALISKIRSQLSIAQQAACLKTCQLYSVDANKYYTSVMKQFQLGILDDGKYLSVPKNEKGVYNFSFIKPSNAEQNIFCTLVFIPNEAYKDRHEALAINRKVKKHLVNQANRNIDAAEAAAVEAAKPQAAVPAKPQGPSVSPTGMPTYGPRGNQ